MEPITHPQRLEDVTGTVKGAATADAANVDSEIDETSETSALGSDNADTHVFLHPAEVDTTQSFDEFYRAHAGSVGQALELTLGDRELAEDALNEAMARALQRWKRVARFDNPEGWVYRVAMNWALSWLRRRRRERDRPLATTDTDLQPQDHDLEQALAGLSIDHRSVVVCRFFLDWSVKRTAESLDIAEGTVKSRLARALDNIKKELEGPA